MVPPLSSFILIICVSFLLLSCQGFICFVDLKELPFGLILLFSFSSLLISTLAFFLSSAYCRLNLLFFFYCLKVEAGVTNWRPYFSHVGVPPRYLLPDSSYLLCALLFHSYMPLNRWILLLFHTKG